MSGEGFTITGSDLFSGDFAVTEVASVATDTGVELLSSVEAASVFDYALSPEEVASFGTWQQAGSLAGNADYFDFFYGGDMTDEARRVFDTAGFGDIGPGAFGPEVVDRVGVITPGEVARNAALAFGEIGPGPGPGTGFSLTQVASQVQTEFTNIGRGLQQAQQFLNRAAPVVNLVSGILRVPNPLAPLSSILNQATAVAQAGNAVAGLAGDATRSLRPTTGAPVPVRGADGLFTVTLPADQVQTSTATPVVVDAQTRANYDTAVNTVQELTPSLQILSTRLEDQTIEINQYQTRISELQSELATNTELTESERQTRALEINFFEAETARVEQERTDTSQLAFQTQTQLSSAERIIATTNASVISAPLVVTSAPGGAPGAPPPDYDAARRTVQGLAPTDQILRQQVVDQGIQIKDNKDRIAELQAELDNDLELSQLTLEQRNALQQEIQDLQAGTAVLEQRQVETARLALETSRQLDAAREVIATTDASAVPAAGAVPGTGPAPFSTVYNPTTNTWSILDTATGTTVSTGLTEQQARDAQIRLAITAASIALKSAPGAVSAQDPKAAALTALQLAAQLAQVNTAAGSNIVAQQNAVTAGLTDAARNQAAVRSLRNNKAQSTDWRVRLRLAPNSNYLYNDTQPGILAALRGTDGVVFPYTPSIDTAYKANYEAYDLTHSNYRGYFYRNSYVDVINIRATFTAQDTNEANYLLAVIHFFRSATKMFYGQDASLRGAPPPLVYLNGYGNYQFSEHPCVISQFNYQLPPDVDYIRCQSWLNNNTNLQLARLRNPIANNPLAYSVNRLLNSRLLPGAKDFRPSLANNLADGEPTYVPTKMEISISLLPIQSRAQVSQNFSVKGFADGNLLKGGYW